MTARHIPLWDMGSPASAPLGLPMCQNRAAIPTWSFAMERLPPARILELGTYSGGFITALAVHAWWIGARVTTFDRVKPHEGVAQLGDALGVAYVQTPDLFEPDRVALIGAMICEPGVTFLLCDGGNKPRELATFAKYLKPGDVIAAHDYVPLDGPQGDAVYWPCGEITEAQGAAVAAEYDLEPWMQDHFDLAAWLVYRKRGAP
jgi:hypothetical protein